MSNKNGRPKKTQQIALKHASIRLTLAEIAQAKELGQGEVSAGIRYALAVVRNKS